MKNSKLLTTMFLLGIAAVMTACGSRNSATAIGTSDLSSTSTSQYNVASCNQKTSSGIAASLKTYTSNGSTDFNYVWVRMTTLPNGFAAGTSNITFFKWMANSSGSTYLDSTRLSFVMVDSQTGQYLISNWVTSLSWSDVSTTAQGLGIYDAQTFFNRMNILVYLNDPSAQYDVLKIASYSTSSTSVQSQMDILLPPFSANPNAYATESDGSTRASVLQALHPFASYKSSGYSDSQFVSMAQSYCF